MLSLCENGCVGVREQHRANQIETIKRVARELLATSGTEGLALRAIAREMGQTSSAMYRYFANRDELLTALIVDAYNDLGATVERAEAKIDRHEYFERFAATGTAVRRWALAHPHEYALIFGTPIPSYQAPPETIVAASRVVLVLATILNDLPREQHIRRTGSLKEKDLERGISEFLIDISTAQAGRALVTWSSLFGLISFEIFGHFVGSVKNRSGFFEASLNELWRGLLSE